MSNDQPVHEEDVLKTIKFGELSSDEDIVDLDRRLQDLMTLAPSDSWGTLLIISKQHFYRSLITIQSIRGRSVAGASGSDFSRMVDELFRRMREKLRKTATEQPT